MADHEVFEEPNFVLQKGAMLPVARLAYKTVGALNVARDNAVLVPSWYTGTHNDTETYTLGETRALDPRRYFIILTNLLANGLSSSPSNTLAPFERGRFPHVTIYDNVRLQQLLLNSTLGNRTIAARDRLVDGRMSNLPVGGSISRYGPRCLSDCRLGTNSGIQPGFSPLVTARLGIGPGIQRGLL